MAKINDERNGCVDVFGAFLVKNAVFAGAAEIPCIAAEKRLPTELISFSKCIRSKQYWKWVHFYEDDANFIRIWRYPKRYLSILKKFEGVIAPDFSIYRDMPLVMQQWNIYRSHAIAHWLQENGIPVIANIRFGDERTYETCCLGVPRYSTIAVGSHGCIRIRREREYFQRGLEYVVNNLIPKVILVYGAAPESVFGKYAEKGIRILQFDSDCMKAHKKAVTV